MPVLYLTQALFVYVMISMIGLHHLAVLLCLWDMRVNQVSYICSLFLFEFHHKSVIHS